VKFVGVFNKDARSMVPYIGFQPRVDTSLPRDVCDWSAGDIEPGLIEMSHQMAQPSG